MSTNMIEPTTSNQTEAATSAQNVRSILPGNELLGDRVLGYCRDCHSHTILFSQTIQTFCFHCGQPITQLDDNGLYYH